jgi:hypothetical protein
MSRPPNPVIEEKSPMGDGVYSSPRGIPSFERFNTFFTALEGNAADSRYVGTSESERDGVDEMVNALISITGFGIAALLSRGAMATAAKALAERGRSAGLR